MNSLKITIVGSGYVGMSLAVLLAQDNEVVVLDIDQSRVEKINNKKSTVRDSEIEEFLIKKDLNITATLDKGSAYNGANYIVIATPTDFNPDNKYFDTRSVDSVLKDALHFNKDALIIIKSTIPIGYTKLLTEKHNTKRIIFSPEFLREGQALKDNLHPSRIIIGSENQSGKTFANLLVAGAKKKNINILYMNSTEAEAVKLFANTYLAMRVSFFNELDTYALTHNLESRNIINGICSDNRIGEVYNNPSFGYGGYCLPKDTKQLLANYKNIPQSLIQAIVDSNSKRGDYLAKVILKKNPKIVGVYRLVMKAGSDNFRESAIQPIMKKISSNGIKIVIFEPELDVDEFCGFKVLKNLKKFKDLSDVILTNRFDNKIKDVDYKVFTRDIYGIN
jgi:UDPglucose 6-dehydrogenase